MRKVLTSVLMVVAAVFSNAINAAEVEIPRTMVDKGTYYLLDAKTKGGITTTLHKRVGVNETGYPSFTCDDRYDAGQAERYFVLHYAPRGDAISKEEYEILVSQYTRK